MDFKKLKDLLTSRSLPELFKRRLNEAEAVSRWESAVGPTIARHAQAIRVEDGVLHVEVGHPIWRSELHHRRRQILEILNQGSPEGAALLVDLHFVDQRKRMTSPRATAETTHQPQIGSPKRPGSIPEESGS